MNHPIEKKTTKKTNKLKSNMKYFLLKTSVKKHKNGRKMTLF